MARNLLALVFVGFLVSCASGPRTSGTGAVVPPNMTGSVGTTKDLPQGLNKVAAGPIAYRTVQDSPEVGRFYQAARKLYDQGQSREAFAQFRKYVQAAPSGQFADEALYLLAKDSYDNNDFESASKSYRLIAAFDPPSRLRGDSQYLDAVCQYNLGNRKDSLAQLAKIDLRELSAAQKPKIFQFWGRVASEEGRWLEAALALIKARSMTDDAAQKNQIEQLVEDQIESRLSEAELTFVLQEYPNTYPAPQIQMRLVSLKMASGKRAEAKELLMGILNQSAPGSVVHKKAADLSGRLQSLGDALPTRVGALLPLSGPRADQGRAVADGLQMALAVNNVAGIELVLADTGPTDESAVKAFERLVFEDRVMAVVGPLYGTAADLVAAKASELGVPNVALSARSGLIEKGPFVFRLALTPERQVRAAVGYAKEKLGAKRFAVIFPQDSFGREFALEYIRAVEDFDCTVTGIASYDPKQSDFKVEIEDLVGTGFWKFRATEVKENKQRIEDALQRPATDKELEGRLMPPIVDFDVLFLPDTFKALGQIAPALMYADVRNVQLMGPATWRNSQLLSRAGHYLEKALFVDSFASERQSRVTRDFVEKFEKTKGRLPSSFAAQGFDVGSALKQAYSEGRTPQNRDDLRSRLANLGSFDGAMGMQTWDARREALSEMQLFEIRKSNFQHLGGITIRPRKD